MAAPGEGEHGVLALINTTARDPCADQPHLQPGLMGELP